MARTAKALGKGKTRRHVQRGGERRQGCNYKCEAVRTLLQMLGENDATITQLRSDLALARAPRGLRRALSLTAGVGKVTLDNVLLTLIALGIRDPSPPSSPRPTS